MVLNELIETEKVYINELKSIIEVSDISGVKKYREYYFAFSFVKKGLPDEI